MRRSLAPLGATQITMTHEEIKIRQLYNQHLIAKTDRLTVVRDILGAQAQFYKNALHSLKIRCADYDEATVGIALVKNWSVRGTIHAFAESDLPLFIHCGALYRKNDWHEKTVWSSRSDWALTPERQRYFSQIIVKAVSEAPKSRYELKAICRKSGMTPAEEGSMFHPWGGGIRELCTRGFMHYSACEEKVLCASPHFEPMPEERAKLELARRYFTNIAPATIKDAAYFFGTTQAQVKGWLDRLPVSSAECHGKAYYYIENGSSCDADIPECIFLAGFDQLILGYDKRESPYLSGEDMRKIFNLAGIVMPSVLLHGVVVGRWKLKGKKLRVELFRSLGSGDISIIKRQAAELWSDTVSVEVST